MIKTVVKSNKHPRGYIVNEELWSTVETEPPTPVIAAYTEKGDYIGDPTWAYALIARRHIAPEKAKPEHCVCSIGYCEREEKWYGWSHRALCGFGIGDMLYEEDCPGCNDETPIVQHGTKKIETLEEAKQAAINFAASVS